MSLAATDFDPTELESLAQELALEAGKLARRRRSEGVKIAATKSTLADIVTDADREVEALIRERLESARAGDGFYGEESAPGSSSSGITWVVDPIDGTVNYSFNIPAYAVSIAAVQGDPATGIWTPVAGVVYNPATDELFSASAGNGARLDGALITVRQEADPAGALLATGFGYDRATHPAAMELIEQVMPIMRDIRRGGSAALDLAFVAAGRLDGYFERGLNPWDYAAGELLVTEAGGQVRAPREDGPQGGMLITSSSASYASLRTALGY